MMQEGIAHYSLKCAIIDESLVEKFKILYQCIQELKKQEFPNQDCAYPADCDVEELDKQIEKIADYFPDPDRVRSIVERIEDAEYHLGDLRKQDNYILIKISILAFPFGGSEALVDLVEAGGMCVIDNTYKEA